MSELPPCFVHDANDPDVVSLRPAYPPPPSTAEHAALLVDIALVWVVAVAVPAALGGGCWPLWLLLLVTLPGAGVYSLARVVVHTILRPGPERVRLAPRELRVGPRRVPWSAVAAVEELQSVVAVRLQDGGELTVGEHQPPDVRRALADELRRRCAPWRPDAFDASARVALQALVGAARPGGPSGSHR